MRSGFPHINCAFSAIERPPAAAAVAEYPDIYGSNISNAGCSRITAHNPLVHTTVARLCDASYVSTRTAVQHFVRFRDLVASAASCVKLLNLSYRLHW